MTGLVPEPNPSQQRVRERAEEGKKIFLARSGRSSCAPFPGSRALCEVGLAACFFIFWSFLVFAIGAVFASSAKPRPVEGGGGSAGEGKNHCSARSGLAVFRFWPCAFDPSCKPGSAEGV